MTKVLCVIGSKKASEHPESVDKNHVDSFPSASIEIGRTIKNVLGKKGLEVDLISAETPRDPLNYAYVIIGSGIYGSRPHESTIAYVRSFKEQLKQSRTAVFAVCGTLGAEDPWKREKGLKKYSQAMNFGINPESSTAFGGYVEDTGSFGNWLGKLIIGANPGDYRDSAAVAQWASSLDI